MHFTPEHRQVNIFRLVWSDSAHVLEREPSLPAVRIIDQVRDTVVGGTARVVRIIYISAFDRTDPYHCFSKILNAHQFSAHPLVPES